LTTKTFASLSRRSGKVSKLLSLFVRRPRMFLENILNIRSSTISVTYCFKIEAY